MEELGKQKGLLGLIVTKSQNKFQDPAKLPRLIVDLIDKETWVSMSADVRRCLRGPAGARCFDLNHGHQVRREPGHARSVIIMVVPCSA